MDIETVIQAARDRQRQDGMRDDHPFVKQALSQLESKGYFTAGTLDDESEEPVVLLHPLPSENREIMFHDHNCFELAYVYRGVCRNKQLNYEITLSQGDLLLMNPRVIHCMCTDDDESVVFNFLVPVKLFDNTFLGLLPNNPISDFFMSYFYQTRTETDFLIVNGNSDAWLLALLERLILEYHEKKPGYETILRTGLAQVFVCMARNYGESLKGLPLQHTSRLVCNLMLYIAKNTASVTLSDAARAFSYNEKYISRLMKRELGLSFTQFVQRQRLQNAAELLVKTNLNVEEIVRMVGYTNLSHFYDLFQKRFGMTPAAYRARSELGLSS